MAFTVKQLLDHAAKIELERQLGYKITKKEFEAYCAALSKVLDQEEVDAAIQILESRGYKVTK